MEKMEALIKATEETKYWAVVSFISLFWLFVVDFIIFFNSDIGFIGTIATKYSVYKLPPELVLAIFIIGCGVLITFLQKTILDEYCKNSYKTIVDSMKSVFGINFYFPIIDSSINYESFTKQKKKALKIIAKRENNKKNNISKKNDVDSYLFLRDHVSTSQREKAEKLTIETRLIGTNFIALIFAIIVENIFYLYSQAVTLSVFEFCYLSLLIIFLYSLAITSIKKRYQSRNAKLYKYIIDNNKKKEDKKPNTTSFTVLTCDNCKDWIK